MNYSTHGKYKYYGDEVILYLYGIIMKLKSI